MTDILDCSPEHVQSLEAERDRLKAEVAELKRDAEGLLQVVEAGREERDALKAEVEELKASYAATFQKADALRELAGELMPTYLPRGDPAVQQLLARAKALGVTCR